MMIGKIQTGTCRWKWLLQEK